MLNFSKQLFIHMLHTQNKNKPWKDKWIIHSYQISQFYFYTPF